MKKLDSHICCLFAVILLLTSSCEEKNDTIPQQEEYCEITNKIMNNSTFVSQVLSDTTFVVDEGVEETDIHLLKMNGYTARLFILKVDLKIAGLKLKTCTPYNLSDFGLQKVSKMAGYVNSSACRVLAGINGDFYNTITYEPMGILVKNGVIIKDEFSDNSKLQHQALSFVGIQKNGKPIIGTVEEYSSIKDSLQEATGGGFILMRNGEIPSIRFTTHVDPRTAMGYTSNDVVYLVVVDGRDFYHSYGMYYNELSQTMNALGVTDAINLDGGGSATLVIKSPLADVFQVRNKPSDGKEREVSNGWLVISDIQ